MTTTATLTAATQSTNGFENLVFVKVVNAAIPAFAGRVGALHSVEATGIVLVDFDGGRNILSGFDASDLEIDHIA